MLDAEQIDGFRTPLEHKRVRLARTACLRHYRGRCACRNGWHGRRAQAATSPRAVISANAALPPRKNYRFNKRHCELDGWNADRAHGTPRLVCQRRGRLIRRRATGLNPDKVMGCGSDHGTNSVGLDQVEHRRRLDTAGERIAS